MAAAREWFESIMWPDGRMGCLKCGSTDGAYRVKSGKPHALPVPGVQAVLQPEDEHGTRPEAT